METSDEVPQERVFSFDWTKVRRLDYEQGQAVYALLWKKVFDQFGNGSLSHYYAYSVDVIYHHFQDLLSDSRLRPI